MYWNLIMKKVFFTMASLTLGLSGYAFYLSIPFGMVTFLMLVFCTLVLTETSIRFNW